MSRERERGIKMLDNERKVVMKATYEDIKHIESLYEGRRPFYGDLHNHANTGGTSDGNATLAQWREGMEKLDMDFAAILDHRQVRHMYEPEWEDGVFIGGTEPGTRISDSKAEVKEIHYNMIFENAEPLERLLEKFPEYEFTGGREGHFIYPEFTRARMGELISFIKENGGFFVHPHPGQIMRSDDPLEYWFADETGFEVFYRDMRNEESKAYYKLWCDVLAKGKRVFATAGDDRHVFPATDALTTIYAEEKTNKSYISHLRRGDIICGGVGIKMAIGDTLMGGVTSFDGKKLVVSVSDFHKSVLNEEHTYKMLLINGKGIVTEEKVLPCEKNVFSFDTDKCDFYRVEIFDETENLRIAIGNPIWNK